MSIATAPIDAATVVVARDTDNGVEVLMLRRNSKIYFGGMWVFPGGRVDPADREDETQVFVCDDSDGRGFLAAAVREAQEEAGIDISKCKLKRPPNFHSDSTSKHVLFWVETDVQPIPNHHQDFLDQKQFTKMPLELNPRLLYDKGYTMKMTREKLGFED